MRFPPISKTPAVQRAANLTDYARTCREFSWEGAGFAISGLPGGRGLNIAYEAVDRHADGPRRSRTAIRFVGADSASVAITYADLACRTSKFANVLRGLGVRPGERVYTLLGRVPELYVAMLGALKAGCVVSPLFSAFGPEPVRQRMALGEASVLVTTAALYRRKVAPIRGTVPSLRHVLVVGESDGDLIGLGPALAAADQDFAIEPTAPEDAALLHFTSGTTGVPKGAVHVHQAVLGHHVTAGYALDLRPDDIFWCTADPGWVTGTSYGVIAPLTHGATVISDAGDFDARRWYQVLSEQSVSNWYTAPTALRMLMRAGDEMRNDVDLSALRFVASVGEPLNPEVVVWSNEVLGVPVHDNWWQTETGSIMISNLAAEEIRPGSMGLPLPGTVAAVLVRGADGRAEVSGGRVREVAGDDADGELALRAGWPSMFRGYWGDEDRYARAFADGWYLTGDIARRDADGYYWFVGRADDVIKSAGHLVGPFEVESALMAHPAVAEVGVIGKPDPVAGEVVKAFVSLLDGYAPTEQLREELTAFGRRALGAVAPKQIEFARNLPHTRSGKVMRRLLKARELGLPEGDTSTVEEPA